MKKDMIEMLEKFKNSIRFCEIINSVDLNFLDMENLKQIEIIAQELQIAISGFDLDMYKHDDEMVEFIFKIWKKEAQIALEVSEKILKKYMEEYL